MTTLTSSEEQKIPVANHHTAHLPVSQPISSRAASPVSIRAPSSARLSLDHENHRDEYLRSKLLTGSIFLKHGNRGSPHHRFVWCSADLSKIYWGDLNKKKIHGFVLTGSILTITKGHQSKIFKERAPKGCDPARCFTLKTTSRTLDLEAISEQERDTWVSTFQYLIATMAEKHAMRLQASLSMPISPKGRASFFSVASDSTGPNEQASDTLSLPKPDTRSRGPSDDFHIASPRRSDAEDRLREEIAILSSKLCAAEAEKKRLLAQIDKWEEDNRRLYMSGVQHKIAVQKQLDEYQAWINKLNRENSTLRLQLGVSSPSNLTDRERHSANYDLPRRHPSSPTPTRSISSSNS